MYGQGNYAPQFRPGPPPPPPPQQPPSVPLPPFHPGLPGPPHSVTHQVLPGRPLLPYQHGVLPAPPAQQAVHRPPPPPVNMGQPYLRPHPPIHGSAPMVHSYAQPSPSYPPQPMPLPPRMVPPPPPQSHPQGQVLYRTPPPPPPGIQHVPTPPPPPLSSFVTVTPASSYGQASVGDAHPPSLPPPPPPPPPSSPPPLPPSPPPPNSPMPDFVDVVPKAPSLSSTVFTTRPLEHGTTGEVRGGGGNIGEVGTSENKIPLVEGKVQEDLRSPPPKPVEEVVRNIEVLCQFIAKFGPDFENMARAKEAGNPQFAFLFGGEPGSAAAIGHEYFQWMKRKSLSERESHKNQEQDVSASRTLMMEAPLQSSNVEDNFIPVSPAISDMDMGDDDSQPDTHKEFDQLSKESTGGSMTLSSENHVVRGPLHAPQSTTEQLASEVAGSGAVSYSGVGSLHDGEDEKDSSFIEDVSPVRTSTDAVENTLDDNVQGSLRTVTSDSSLLKVSPTTTGCKTEEAPSLYVKGGSPFRLIQDYASDDSEEDDKKENVEDSNTASASPTVGVDASGLHRDMRSELYSNFSPESISTKEFRSKSEVDSSRDPHSTMPREGASFLRDTQTSSPSDRERYDDVPTCETSQENDLLDGDKDHPDRQDGKRHLEEDAKLDSSMLDVDEFGRLVRKGMSDSDSEEMHSNRRLVKRGRSRSRSRSPQGSRRRRRSRSPRRSHSPRRRDKRSRSRSWSPKSRSKSPAFRRTNVFARRDRDRDQPPDCFNFYRGRCFRGASCRYLHRDHAWHMNRQQQYQDLPRESVKYDGSYAAPFSDHENTTETEMDVEECNNSPLEEAKGLEMQSRVEQSEASTKITDAGDFDDKDILASVVDDGQPIVKNDAGESQVTGHVSQEVVTHMLETQVENVSEAPNFSPTAEERTQPPSQSSQHLPTNNTQIQPSLADETQSTPRETLLGQPSSGEIISSQHPQSNSPTTISEPQNVNQYSYAEGPISHPVPTQTSHSAPFQSQAPTTQPYIGHAPVTQTYSTQNSVTSSYATYLPTDQSSFLKQFPPPSFSAPHAHLPSLFPPDHPSAPSASQHPIGNLPPTTSHQSQPPPPHMFPSYQPMASEYHSHAVPPNPMWSNIRPPPPPPPLHVNGYPARPAFPSMEFPLPQHQQNTMPLRNDSNPLRRPYPPGEVARSQGFDFHPQPYHFVETSHQPLLHVDDFKRRPLPMGNQQDHPFVREDWFSRPATSEGSSVMLHSRKEFHLQNQSFLRSPFAQGGSMRTQSHPDRIQSFPGDHLEPRPFPGEESSTPSARDMPYSHHGPSYGQQHLASSSFPSNFGTNRMADPTLQRYPLSFAENKPPHLSDVGVPRMSISTHYNPFASTFEQSPTSLKIGSSVSGRENDVTYSSKYDSSFTSGQVPVGGPRSRMTASSPNSRRSGEHFLPRGDGYAHETSTEVPPDIQKQVAREPVAGDAYDPLFDSIEPSSSSAKKLNLLKEPDPVINDAGIMSKLSSLHRPADVQESSRQKGDLGAEQKSEVDEFGEVATDAEAGAVENESPQPVDEKDWSPGIAVDAGNTAAGEIEIDQVKSPGKSKKSKDSRSMKLFKIALADFVKEVLKPSWRQGNMSKEAFKTIVKKTVDKVSGAMPSHQIPKSQVKINQYVESSQRKLTKLVMGYVDKYVKM